MSALVAGTERGRPVAGDVQRVRAEVLAIAYSLKGDIIRV